MEFRSAKSFLIYGGIVLLAVGVLGFGLIGPTADSSLFGELWVFTMAENWAHIILGLVALAAAFMLKDTGQQRMLVNLVGVIALLFGLVGFFPTFLGAYLQNPLDNLLHIIVAIWAFWAATGSTGMSSTPPPQRPPAPGTAI